ncbi:MAG TPA: aspartate aminotransferase family protein [Chthonomonadaceae bacterium]|nr:aspartate aminotransferase family protein [Chthonomonadaceae bacterium]
MGKPFDITPQPVPPVETPFRRIASPIPHPDSVPTLRRLLEVEPRSMSGQPPIVWEKAEGVQVYDAYGNKWLDWSSGVLVANAGHGIPAIREAIIDQVHSGLLHNYCFPSEERAQLAQRLVELAPAGIEKCFLLTTGSETTECALKLARSWGQRTGGPRKIGIVSFHQSFHGRTMGAQQMGRLGDGHRWIQNLDPDIHHVPFPDGYRVEDTRFDLFLRTLEEQGIMPDRIAGVISETYQGAGPDFLPVEYAQQLRRWCDEHGVVLIFDEVQAGFGRCGTFWGFEHYGVVPDLITCGKGITSSLPLAAVLGRAAIMDQYDPGSMTSTHSGNPVCCRAALASIQAIVEGGLVENARRMEGILLPGLYAIQRRHPQVIGCVHGKGLVAGLQIVHPGTKDPYADLAHRIVEKSFQRGLLFFAPVGIGGGCVKISPPLCITEAALQDGLEALNAACDEAIAALAPGH